MRKSLVWEGNLNKKKNFLDCRTWNELLENIKKNTKKEVRLILTLHPSLLQYSPICHFYFLGSPLCFSSCCLHLSVPSRSYQAPSEPITVAPFHPKDTPNLPGLTNLSANSASCLKQAMNRTNKHTHINLTTGPFTVHTQTHH